MTLLPAEETLPPAVEADGMEPKKEEEGISVYVGNLAWRVDSNELQAHMEQAGEVIKAFVFQDYQRRSKGCGIVVYKTEEAAEKAIKELTDSTLSDRRIFVREDREYSSKPTSGGRNNNFGQENNSRSRPPRSDYHQRGGNYRGGAQGQYNNSGRQIFVSNLPWKTSWQDLKDIFRECGEIVRADVMMNPQGRSKGVGTVLFATSEAANLAVERFNNHSILNRPLSVRIDHKEF